ncbi:MAG: hypothetical protein K6B14_10040 [Lachnospiraceae bacterium]|nr:hypothetical protein [Lachnospiraceae bacterium]
MDTNNKKQRKNGQPVRKTPTAQGKKSSPQKIRRTGSGNSQTSKAGAGAKPDQREKQYVTPKRFRTMCKVLALVFVILFVIALMMDYGGCEAIKANLPVPVYEDGTPGYEPDADITADDTMLNLPVLPPYIITAEKPDILIPYPQQNSYDIELSIKSVNSDDVLYRTNRITPGMIVSIPAYDFIEKSGNYRVEVDAFDHDTYKPIETQIVLAADITRK